MKKVNKKLSLNKRSITNLTLNNIKGGRVGTDTCNSKDNYTCKESECLKTCWANATCGVGCIITKGISELTLCA